MTSSAPTAVLDQLAPEGRLVAAINFGNPVLAFPHADDGTPQGVSVALARALAERLGVALVTRVFDTAGQVFGATDQQQWTLAFLAIEPVRAEKIAFSEPYALIEGTYLVRDDGPFTAVEQLDRPGNRIVVGRGAAYDLYLSRTLEHAELLREASSQAAVDAFVKGLGDAAAGVRQPLEKAASKHPGLRVLDGRFTAIRQAVGVPKANTEAAEYVHAFVEEMKRTGFVRQALIDSGRSEVTVAP
ncbi:ABC transporter substrate-binding protein [Halotalea alkalilenta]|uniref:Restriction endonuclease n=1 Tax=Halotalea alkalilenta TaxID=376489 RepID=A0A172YEH5_9GAMM|nr:ABC transporter substrate-binding protein [Halotalea alkalilenta]ANF57375.1 restriction endonuclease [Halotalea alkalilenta]